MSGKRWAQLGAVMVLILSAGCCRFCERWCAPPAPHCCVPVNPQCAPVQPVCPPGTVPANYQPAAQQQGWQRTYTQPANGCQ